MNDIDDIQLLNTFKLPKGFRGRAAITVQLWWLVQEFFFRLSPQFMYAWRRFLLRGFGCKIGKKVLIRPSVRITYPWNVTIGDFSWVGDDVVLYSLGKINIGANVVISQRSYLCAASHDYTSRDFPITCDEICVHDQAWVATDVFIAPGVTIGKGSVVGARSSVFCDLSPMMIYNGNPARLIKPRSLQDRCAS